MSSRLERLSHHVVASAAALEGNCTTGALSVSANSNIKVEISPNGGGFITLSRPKALNALNYNMMSTILELLLKWRSDDRVRFVVFLGDGKKAFCAGGDIRSLAEPASPSDPPEFFRVEYIADALISSYPKPVVSVRISPVYCLCGYYGGIYMNDSTIHLMEIALCFVSWFFFLGANCCVGIILECRSRSTVYCCQRALTCTCGPPLSPAHF